MVGLIGAVAERLIVRRFYGQIVTTMLATWGLSLFLIGLVTAIFGNTTRGVAAPLGSVAIGAYSVSAYQLVLIAITIVVTALCFLVLARTRWGLIARGRCETRKWLQRSASIRFEFMRRHSSSGPR